MITKIKVKNFRSIKELDTDLSRLTVLIGANGTGKSNLVKLIELIGDISRSGIYMAINKRGGAEWLLPKAIPKKLMKSTTTEISYTTCFRPPNHNKVDYKDKKISVNHNLKLKFKSGRHLHVESESIVLKDVLFVAKALQDSSFDPAEIDRNHPSHPESDTFFQISIEEKGGLSFKCYPEVDKENIDDYAVWLGLSKKLFALGPRYFNSTLKKLWDSRIITGSRVRDRIKKGSYSLVDPDITTVLHFCPQFKRFISEVDSVARYDLLLHELRKEQSLSEELALSTNGTNMPSVLMDIKGKENTPAWTRLKETFCAIAPHISQLDSSTLHTNKEFIEFTESALGRSVESWEASDGTLRALGVMLAIESARAGSVIIIEEPEQNLHPWAVRILMRYINEMIALRNLQVIITTHSQQVLEAAKPSEVLIAHRSNQSGTTFTKLSDVHPDLEPHELGDLWVQGLLGGVPKYAE